MFKFILTAIPLTIIKILALAGSPFAKGAKKLYPQIP